MQKRFVLGLGLPVSLGVWDVPRLKPATSTIAAWQPMGSYPNSSAFSHSLDRPFQALMGINKGERAVKKMVVFMSLNKLIQSDCRLAHPVNTLFQFVDPPLPTT